MDQNTDSQMDRQIEDLEHEINKRKAEKQKQEAEQRMNQQLKDEYERTISQMEKVGHHYYSNGEKISWEDTFVSEQDDIRDKIYSIEFDIEFLWNKFTFLVRMLFFMSKGFFDHGKSFDQGIEILEDQFMLSQIISPQTMIFLRKEKSAVMVNWDLNRAYEIARDHIRERNYHFQHNFKLLEFAHHFVQIYMLFTLTLPGKFSIMSPMITASGPTAGTGFLIIVQFVLGWFFFRYYAHGNVLMILSLLWTVGQWASMYLLLWNNDVYLYDLRIFRYLVVLAAVIFEFIYICGVSAELDLVWIEGKLYKEDNAVEVLLALIIGETVIYYFPTALVNLFIILKEMTLNQFAWRKKDDFKEGEFFNLFDIDLFHWLDFEENIRGHLLWFAGWTHFFL